jgi:hypothetical protein
MHAGMDVVGRQGYRVSILHHRGTEDTEAEI